MNGQNCVATLKYFTLFFWTDMSPIAIEMCVQSIKLQYVTNIYVQGRNHMYKVISAGMFGNDVIITGTYMCI